jgi:hypothetical protein
MTTFDKPVRRVTREQYKHFRRVTRETYKHYRREIVVSLYADTISLRLKGTRTAFEIPVSYFDGRLGPTRGKPNTARETQPAETIVPIWLKLKQDDFLK